MKKDFFVDYSCLTMAEGLLSANAHNTHVVYDVFFREIPDNGGFAVMAGLSELIDELKNISFSKETLEELKENGFSQALIDYLSNFKFSCDVSNSSPISFLAIREQAKNAPFSMAVLKASFESSGISIISAVTPIFSIT